MRGGLATAYGLSIILACGAIAMSVLGMFGANAELAQRPSVLVSRAGDLANLLVLVPALLVTSGLAWRGSFLGLLLWPGALFYAVYIYAIYLLTVPFTVLVFGYLGLVVLAAATVIAVVSDIDGVQVAQSLGTARTRMTGMVLVALAALTYAGLATQAADLLSAAPLPRSGPSGPSTPASAPHPCCSPGCCSYAAGPSDIRQRPARSSSR